MAFAAFNTGGTFSERGAGKGAGAISPPLWVVATGAGAVTDPLRGAVDVVPELFVLTLVTAWLLSDMGNSFRCTGSDDD